MKKNSIVVWLGMALSILFMALLLRKLDFGQLMAALKTLDFRYLVSAVLLTFVSYWLRAVRWHFLLIHEKKIPLRSLYPAVIIGYMSNNLFPARIGEFVRAWFLAQREKLQTAPVFASLVIDRLVDGMSVMFILFYVLVSVTFPRGMEKAAVMLKTAGFTTLLVFVAIVAFLVLLKSRPMLAISFMGVILKPFPTRFSERLIPLLGSFLEGLRFSPKPLNLLLIVSSSALIWITATIPIYLILAGFGIHLPLSASFFIMVLLVFAVMVPAAPGYIGTYHAACYTGLTVFSVPDTQAIGIALVIHGIGFFPVILAGFYHLWADGLSLGRLRENASASGH